MIFQHTLDLVLAGTKTATSRLVKPGETAVYGSEGQIEAVIHNGREKYRVGKIYAVQPGRNHAAVGRIKLVGIRQQRVSETSTVEAALEGFPSREAFFETWRTIHGADKLNANVWLLTFKLIREA